MSSESPRFTVIGGSWIGILVLASMMSVTAPEASAARIRSKSTVASPYGPMPRSFAAFLDAGPTVWARTKPRVPSNLRITDESGALIEGNFVDYLSWRRNLNPTRFDAIHPNVGPLLRVPPVTSTGNIVPPLVPAQPQKVPPLVPAVPQTVVPEPSTWMIGLVLVAGAWRLRSRSRPRASNLVD
ncbi:MAG: hypothetical protein SFX72_08480 [Isosphaeraceae bacterium]|nr:hypothetical protein [Isosphaeraceae bacterium]